MSTPESPIPPSQTPAKRRISHLDSPQSQISVSEETTGKKGRAQLDTPGTPGTGHTATSDAAWQTADVVNRALAHRLSESDPSGSNDILIMGHADESPLKPFPVDALDAASTRPKPTPSVRPESESPRHRANPNPKPSAKTKAKPKPTCKSKSLPKPRLGPKSKASSNKAGKQACADPNQSKLNFTANLKSSGGASFSVTLSGQGGAQMPQYCLREE
eukprot:s2217_g3.t1